MFKDILNYFGDFQFSMLLDNCLNLNKELFYYVKIIAFAPWINADNLSKSFSYQ